MGILDLEYLFVPSVTSSNWLRYGVAGQWTIQMWDRVGKTWFDVWSGDQATMNTLWNTTGVPLHPLELFQMLDPSGNVVKSYDPTTQHTGGSGQGSGGSDSTSSGGSGQGSWWYVGQRRAPGGVWENMDTAADNPAFVALQNKYVANSPLALTYDWRIVDTLGKQYWYQEHSMKTCLDGSLIAVSATCMKTCADGSKVAETAECMKTCTDGTQVAETAACPDVSTKKDETGQDLILCQDGSWVPAGTNCPTSMNWMPVILATLAGIGIVGGIYVVKKRKTQG